MKKVSKLQRDWIGWILWDQRKWLEKDIEVSEKGMILLQKAYLNGEYEEGRQTELLLNHVLEKFNEDAKMKRKWKEDRAWKVKDSKI